MSASSTGPRVLITGDNIGEVREETAARERQYKGMNTHGLERTSPITEGALRALVEQLDGLGVEMGDEGAWLSNADENRTRSERALGQVLLKYANELGRIQGELAALLPARPDEPQEM